MTKVNNSKSAKRRTEKNAKQTYKKKISEKAKDHSCNQQIQHQKVHRQYPFLHFYNSLSSPKFTLSVVLQIIVKSDGNTFLPILLRYNQFSSNFRTIHHG